MSFWMMFSTQNCPNKFYDFFLKQLRGNFALQIFSHVVNSHKLENALKHQTFCRQLQAQVCFRDFLGRPTTMSPKLLYVHVFIQVISALNITTDNFTQVMLEIRHKVILGFACNILHVGPIGKQDRSNQVFLHFHITTIVIVLLFYVCIFCIDIYLYSLTYVCKCMLHIMYSNLLPTRLYKMNEVTCNL
eukprot:TRINITY_DN1604_c0_g1_i7.p1 TRINITY_DN1604_c0_g1~~TRINITY_DN1604_c0_g1_i7.p1  ORF type:complete len:189 (-),score=-15.85 TRINITY_DN1604_c0_g1_i7:226-792(-)